MAASVPPGLQPRPLCCLCVPQSGLFSGPGCPRSSAKLWCGVSGCLFGQLGLTSLYPIWGQATPVHSSLVEIGFSSLFTCLSSSPGNQEGLSPMCRIPELGSPVCGSTHSLPRASVHLCDLLFPLSHLPGVQVLTQCFLPILPIMCVSFLQPWLYRSLSASFQLVFHEDCSACRCIFD